MGIRVSRYSQTTGVYRLWGMGEVDVFSTALGIAIEFSMFLGWPSV
jgi:hypothetical protein